MFKLVTDQGYLSAVADLMQGSLRVVDNDARPEDYPYKPGENIH